MVLLISDEYREQNRLMHEKMAHYGSGSARHVDTVISLCRDHGHKTVLDYGCGKGLLVKALKERGIDATGYDPAIDMFSAAPCPADLVVCTDVLEHIEPECVEAVLSDIASLTKQSVFFLVSTVEAKKILPDGRNAHLIIKHKDAWLEDMKKHFRVAVLKGNEKGFAAVLVK